MLPTAHTLSGTKLGEDGHKRFPVVLCRAAACYGLFFGCAHAEEACRESAMEPDVGGEMERAWRGACLSFAQSLAVTAVLGVVASVFFVIFCNDFNVTSTKCDRGLLGGEACDEEKSDLVHNIVRSLAYLAATVS